MQKYATDAERAALASAKQKVEQAHRLLGEACLELITGNAGELALVAAQKLHAVEQEVGRASYDILSTQAEWLGGNVENHAVAYRWPHGC